MFALSLSFTSSSVDQQTKYPDAAAVCNYIIMFTSCCLVLLCNSLLACFVNNLYGKSKAGVF